MIKKLTEIQMLELFAFCRKNHVYHYDLQIELVDHLASIIESRWELEPDQSFRMILNQVYSEFGKSSFHMIKLSKEKALRKKYNLLLWKYIVDFIWLPKIILTIAIIFTLFSTFRLFSNYKPMFFSFVGLYALTMLVSFGNLFQNKFRLDLISKNSFLFSDHLNAIKNRVAILGITPIFLSSLYNIVLVEFQLAVSYNVVIQFLVALLMTFLGIVFFAICFYIPKRIKEDFSREFPQFVKS